MGAMNLSSVLDPLYNHGPLKDDNIVYGWPPVAIAVWRGNPPNIYFKPRAISTHSLYMLLVAFLHTQDVGRTPCSESHRIDIQGLT